MLALTDPLVLRVVPPNMAALHLLSWQWLTFAGIWVFTVLYFSDNSLTQGFFYIYNQLIKWSCIIIRRLWK